MLTFFLLAWAWQLRFGQGDLCSAYLAFDDLSLAADEEFVGHWRNTEDAGPGAKTTWSFGYLDSLEFAASVVDPDGYYAEATVEVIVGSVSDVSSGSVFEVQDIVKSCRLDTGMPRSRRCCETEFFSDGIKLVGVNVTCHQARRPDGDCLVKLYARKNRLTTTVTRTLTTTSTTSREVEVAIATTERRLPFFLLHFTVAVTVLFAYPTFRLTFRLGPPAKRRAFPP